MTDIPTERTALLSASPSSPLKPPKQITICSFHGQHYQTMTIDPSKVGFDNSGCYRAVHALAKKMCTSHQVVDEMVLDNVNGVKSLVNEDNALDIIMGSKSRKITVYVKDDPKFQAKMKKMAGKVAAGIGDAVAKKVYNYTADEIASLVVSLGWAFWGEGDGAATTEAEKSFSDLSPVASASQNSTVDPTSPKNPASGKTIPSKLDQYKAELAAKTRSHLSKIKPPTEEADEFSTFWESAIAETIDEIDNAIDFDSADMACSSATARATDLEDGIVKFERVRATGRGRRAKESIIDTIKGIWYSGSGSGQGKLGGGQGLQGMGM